MHTQFLFNMPHFGTLTSRESPKSQEENLGITVTRLFMPHTLPATQPTISKKWNNSKAQSTNFSHKNCQLASIILDLTSDSLCWLSSPILVPSFGPGADPGVQAVSPQVTWSESHHEPSGRLPLLATRPADGWLGSVMVKGVGLTTQWLYPKIQQTYKPSIFLALCQ